MEFTIKICGIFLGVLTRMLLPFLRKLKQKKVDKFNSRYLRIAGVSLILSLIVTLLIFPQFSFSGVSFDFESKFKLFCIAFGFGFGFNSLISEFSEWYRKV